MKKFFFTLIAAIFCLSFVSAEASQTESPVFKPGDYWIYEKTDKSLTKREFVGMEGANYIFLRDGKRVLLDKNLMLVDSQFVDLSFPISVGKSWLYETDGRESNWGNFRLKHYITVEAFEEVETPAGKFKAYRIFRDTITAIRREPRGEVRFWYSPEVGQVIKARWGILKEFKRQ